MKTISIFGLGYVGAVTAACFASRGHRVIGVDPHPLKTQRINDGLSPILEKGVEELLGSAKQNDRISATQNADAAVAKSDISFISVGTPNQRNGKLDLSHIQKVCFDIGQALRKKDDFHWVVARSTVLPGTTEDIIVPALEAASGKKAGRDFAVFFNPEFLREGTSVADFFNPPFTIIGMSDSSHAAPVRELYSFLTARLFEVPLRAAEMVKYYCNAFHALKVAFANEMGTVASSLGADAKMVAEMFMSDTHLNISTAYLRPGFAFGGSCLPKDLRALSYKVKELDLKLPLVESILASNYEHIERAAESVLVLGRRKVGVLGLCFKSGTDDLRESPMVHLVKRLIAEGCEVRIWDENVSLGQLMGSNREFIESYIPHIGTLVNGVLDDVLSAADVIVLGTNLVTRDQVWGKLNAGQYLIDLTSLGQPVLRDDSLITSAQEV
jgi:GDP-mannose 6-dehydrogenase